MQFSVIDVWSLTWVFNWIGNWSQIGANNVWKGHQSVIKKLISCHLRRQSLSLNQFRSFWVFKRRLHNQSSSKKLDLIFQVLSVGCRHNDQSLCVLCVTWTEIRNSRVSACKYVLCRNVCKLLENMLSMSTLQVALLNCII